MPRRDAAAVPQGIVSAQRFGGSQPLTWPRGADPPEAVRLPRISLSDEGRGGLLRIGVRDEFALSLAEVGQLFVDRNYCDLRSGGTTGAWTGSVISNSGRLTHTS